MIGSFGDVVKEGWLDKQSKFLKSSRTKLHYHSGAQLLIVTKGTGSLILYKKKDHILFRRKK